MANKSIFDAFERMWQHIVAKLELKADKDEIQEVYETKAAAGDKLAEAKEYAASEVNALAGQIAYIDTEDNEDVNDTEKPCVKTVNGIEPDGNGNVEIEVGGSNNQSDSIKFIKAWDVATGKTTKSYKINDNEFNINGILTVEEANVYDYIDVDKGLVVYVDYDVIRQINALNRPSIEFIYDEDGIIFNHYGFMCCNGDPYFYFPYYNGETNYFILFKEGYPPSGEE